MNRANPAMERGTICPQCASCEGWRTNDSERSEIDRVPCRIRHRKAVRRITGSNCLYSSMAHSLLIVLSIASSWCTVVEGGHIGKPRCYVDSPKQGHIPDIDQIGAFSPNEGVRSMHDCALQCCGLPNCDMALFTSEMCFAVDCSYSETVCDLRRASVDSDVEIALVTRNSTSGSPSETSPYSSPVKSRHKGLSSSKMPLYDYPDSHGSYPSNFLENAFDATDDTLVGFQPVLTPCYSGADCGRHQLCHLDDGGFGQGVCSCVEGFTYSTSIHACMPQTYTVDRRAKAYNLWSPRHDGLASRQAAHSSLTNSADETGNAGEGHLQPLSSDEQPSVDQGAPQGSTPGPTQESLPPDAKTDSPTTATVHADVIGTTTSQPVQDSIATDIAPTVHVTFGHQPKADETTTPQFRELSVFAGDSRVLTLPEEDHVTLHAMVEPDQPPNGGQYRYDWRLVEGPSAEKMNNGDSLELTKLQAGLYVFDVYVSSPSASGVGHINVTVNPPPRVNLPPVAVVVPSENISMFENEESTLDATKSTDESPSSLTYLWEVVKSPVDENFGPGTEPVYILRGLSPGLYQLKLTVTDEDQATDTRIVNVTVNEEVDNPPVAIAGTTLVKHLPLESIVLNGNESHDDHGIVKWKWTRMEDDGGTADLSGSTEPALKVSQLQEGIYKFQLTVYDRKDQSDSDTVTVHILPEELNTPPEADAGPQKELSLPDDSTKLDGSGSTDDSSKMTYEWTKVSGPESDNFAIADADQVTATVSGLVAGTYTFKLTVTDEQGATDSAKTQVVVKEEVNQPPISNAGKDITITLPINYVELDGSQSSDDKGITSYSWRRLDKSPAAGVFLDGSQSTSLLKVYGLVRGVYSFNLTVTDAKGMTSWDMATVTVKQDPHLNDLIEMVFNRDISAFKESDKKDLILFLQFLLQGDVVLQQVTHTTSGQLQVIFYATNSSSDGHALMKGTTVLETLRNHVNSHDDSSLLKMNLDSYDTVVCQRNCSNHGVCDQFSRKCVCETFWMQNYVRVYLGDGESNCDWSILYVIIIIFMSMMCLGLAVWMFACCCNRKKKKSRRKHQYSLLTEDLEGSDAIELLPKANGNVLDKLTDNDPLQGKQNSSIMVSASGEDTDDEITVYEHRKKRNRLEKKPLNGHIKRSKRYPGRTEKL